MPAPSNIPIDPAKACDFSVINDTPHVIVYKFWLKDPSPGSQWVLIGEGSTNDTKSDHYVVVPPIARNTVFAYWLGVAGHANSVWRATLAVEQAGQAPTKWTESGTTNDNGDGTGVDSIPVRRVVLQ